MSQKDNWLEVDNILEEVHEVLAPFVVDVYMKNFSNFRGEIGKVLGIRISNHANNRLAIIRELDEEKIFKLVIQRWRKLFAHLFKSSMIQGRISLLHDARTHVRHRDPLNDDDVRDIRMAADKVIEAVKETLQADRDKRERAYPGVLLFIESETFQAPDVPGIYAKALTHIIEKRLYKKLPQLPYKCGRARDRYIIAQHNKHENGKKFSANSPHYKGFYIEPSWGTRENAMNRLQELLEACGIEYVKWQFTEG